jgi:UDP-2,3-diacylglucosamine hydrolase
MTPRQEAKRYGIIAGNGRFPVIALETARQQGYEAIAIAIKEEASPEVERAAARCYWLSLGELSRLIEICKSEGIAQIMMAGQVKHAKIFSSIRPDWRLVKLLAGLMHKNTDSLIGAVAKVLEDEGIKLVDSTLLLKPLLAASGALTKRKVDGDEQRDIGYGRRIAHALASLDLGQSVAIADRACVALEAMEGTDAMLRRAASLVEGKRLTLVKASSRRRHLLFDVPVIGPQTIDVMIETNTTALAIDAGRTLLLDKEELLSKANAAKIAIVGMEAAELSAQAEGSVVRGDKR